MIKYLIKYMITILYTKARSRGSEGYRTVVADHDGRMVSRGFTPAKSYEEMKKSLIGSYLHGKPIEEQEYEILSVEEYKARA